MAEIILNSRLIQLFKNQKHHITIHFVYFFSWLFSCFSLFSCEIMDIFPPLHATKQHSNETAWLPSNPPSPVINLKQITLWRQLRGHCHITQRRSECVTDRRQTLTWRLVPMWRWSSTHGSLCAAGEIHNGYYHYSFWEMLNQCVSCVIRSARLQQQTDSSIRAVA